MSYNSFSVGPANSQYQLSISGFTGVTNEDPFKTYNINGMKFTTKDQDNDGRCDSNCTVSSNGNDAGEWWYNHCGGIYPNNQYKSMYETHISGSWHCFEFIKNENQTDQMLMFKH